MSDYWVPSKEWSGQECYCIGGGPSLAGFPFETLAGRNVIGCNEAFRLGGHIVKFCVFGDTDWWLRNDDDLKEFPGRCVTNAITMRPFKHERLHKMERVKDGIHSGQKLGWNYSSGAMAINLAISLGADRVYLLGYDMSRQGQVSHWHTRYKHVTQDAAFTRHMRGFQRVCNDLPLGFDVVNVTDGTSRLEMFRKMSFEDFREHLKGDPRVPSFLQERAA